VHKSPNPRNPGTPASASLTRPLIGGHSAKVCVVAVAWICLIAGWAGQSWAAGRAYQEQDKNKQPEAAAQAQPADPAQPIDLSDEVIRDVLTDLQRGIETHNLDRILEIFDQQNMKDYSQFRDQMAAFLRRYDSVRFRYQLLQVTSDKDGGFAIADLDMDADPSDILPTPQRRSTQMRFQLKRSPKGWKVVAVKPADFFNQ
jgi:hypothetical protein